MTTTALLPDPRYRYADDFDYHYDCIAHLCADHQHSLKLSADTDLNDLYDDDFDAATLATRTCPDCILETRRCEICNIALTPSTDHDMIAS